jgi:hypothetical protein
LECLRLISGNRAWQDSTTSSKSWRALFKVQGMLSCRPILLLSFQAGPYRELMQTWRRDRRSITRRFLGKARAVCDSGMTGADVLAKLV